MKPFFTFYGGKYRVAKWYPPPEHGFIVEPFAGSAGYSVRWANERTKVILVEANPKIARLWRWLTRVPSKEILSLPLMVTDVRLLDVREEAQSLIGFWCNKGSTAPRNKPSRWMRDGTRPKSFWGKEIRERVASQVEQIRQWQIVEGDYSRVSNIAATWFIDPPYQRSGIHYNPSSRDLDFGELADWAMGRRGKVIVCEQEGAEWLPFSFFRNTNGLHGVRGGQSSKEVMWIGEAPRWQRYAIS